MDVSQDKIEIRLVGWSFLYFYCLMAAYFILRPARDEMGISNGASNMHWLFTGTFIVMILIVPLFGYVVAKYKTIIILKYSYLFFISNILLFYILFKFQLFTTVTPALFFIWLSVFNLFAISIFWSLMVDLFSIEQSKQLFGIIALGGSLGALTGPYLVQIILAKYGISELFLLAIAFTLFTIFSLNRISKISKSRKSNFYDEELVLSKIGFKDLFEGIKLIIRSNYLLGIVGFMLLYTSISTFLYFEQAHIVEHTLKSSNERLLYFSRIDLWVNGITTVGQLLLTARLLVKMGIVVLLSIIPLIIGVGFWILSSNISLIIISVLFVIHRSVNYIVLKPAREILYITRTKREKYKAKNVIDTLIYRGGDSLAGWLFAGFVSFGLSLSVMALIAVPLTLIWASLGYSLGLKQKEELPQLSVNFNTNSI